MINQWIGILRCIQLIDDVDGLGGHPQLRHERIKSDNLLLLQSGLRDQVIKLNAQHDLALGAQLRAKFLRHGREILLLVKRLPEQLAQLRINSLRIIVTQKSEARVDFFFEQNTIRLRKTGQDLDQQRQQVRSFRYAARLAQGATHPLATGSPHPVGKRRHALHRAVDFICNRCDQFRHVDV